MMAGRRVLVLEDDADFRAALHTTLTHRGHEVVASYDRAAPAVEGIVAARPDVALVDLALPGMSGLDAIKRFQQVAPHVRIVVLSANNTAEDLLGSLRAGAIGYLVKGARLLDIAGSVEAAASGLSPISPEAGRHLVEQVAPQRKARAAAPASLTAREHDVLALLVEGKSYDTIATALSIGIGTVQNYVKSVYRKLDVSSKAEATAVALRNGLVSSKRNDH